MHVGPKVHLTSSSHLHLAFTGLCTLCVCVGVSLVISDYAEKAAAEHQC